VIGQVAQEEGCLSNTMGVLATDNSKAGLSEYTCRVQGGAERSNLLDNSGVHLLLFVGHEVLDLLGREEVESAEELDRGVLF